jgi:hypothetical protein
MGAQTIKSKEQIKNKSTARPVQTARSTHERRQAELMLGGVR